MTAENTARRLIDLTDMYKKSYFNQTETDENNLLITAENTA